MQQVAYLALARSIELVGAGRGLSGTQGIRCQHRLVVAQKSDDTQACLLCAHGSADRSGISAVTSATLLKRVLARTTEGMGNLWIRLRKLSSSFRSL